MSNRHLLFLDPHSDPDYCGSCKTTPCLVSSGQACCHDMIRYGYCSHEPLVQVEEEDSDQSTTIWQEESIPVRTQCDYPRQHIERHMAPRPERSFDRPMGDRPTRPVRRS